MEKSVHFTYQADVVLSSVIILAHASLAEWIMADACGTRIREHRGINSDDIGPEDADQAPCHKRKDTHLHGEEGG